MSLNKNFVLLFAGSFLLTACAEDGKFPELRASQNVSEDKIYEETTEAAVAKQDEMIEVDIRDNLSDVTVDNQGTVIIAVAHPKPDAAEENFDKEESLKIKPILKKKSKATRRDPILKTDRSPSSLKLYDVQEDIAQEASNVTIDNNVLAEVQAQATVSSKVSQEQGTTYQLDTFYFDNGSSSVRSADRAKIKKIVKLAKEKNATLYVLGFSSSRTADTDYVTHKMANFKISLARAESVSDALISSGMKSDKVLVEALSDARPAYLEVMPEGERLNRRVEVYIGY